MFPVMFSRFPAKHYQRSEVRVQIQWRIKGAVGRTFLEDDEHSEDQQHQDRDESLCDPDPLESKQKSEKEK